MDKTQAFHQLHWEQLCKLRLSIPSKNVVKGHRVTYGRENWRRQVGSRNQLNLTRHAITEEMKEWLERVAGRKSSWGSRPQGPTPICNPLPVTYEGGTIHSQCPGNRVPWAKFQNFQGYRSRTPKQKAGVGTEISSQMECVATPMKPHQWQHTTVIPLQHYFDGIILVEY